MRPGEATLMHEVQCVHWWYVGRRWFVKRLIDAHQLAPSHILEIGCGPGTNLEMLFAYAPATGVDPSGEALQLARRHPHDKLICAPADRLPLADASYDLVCLLDVLEHLPDDRRGLAEAWRVLQPGGKLLVSVPAHPGLFSGHDEAMQHFRRYTRTGFDRLIRALPGRPLFLGGWNALLLGPIAAARLLSNLTRRWRRSGPAVNDLRRPAFGLNDFLAFLLKLDSKVALTLGRRGEWAWPWGLSYFALVEKSSHTP